MNTSLQGGRRLKKKLRITSIQQGAVRSPPRGIKPNKNKTSLVYPPGTSHGKKTAYTRVDASAIAPSTQAPTE